MTEHKIQSRSGDLQLQLTSVPKMLYLMKSVLCPSAFMVTFKLETDGTILEEKAQRALLEYKHEAVVANLLHRRHEEVMVYHKRLGDNACTEFPTVRLERSTDTPDLDSTLVSHIVQVHNAYLTSLK